MKWIHFGGSVANVMKLPTGFGKEYCVSNRAVSGRSGAADVGPARRCSLMQCRQVYYVNSYVLLKYIKLNVIVSQSVGVGSRSTSQEKGYFVSFLFLFCSSGCTCLGAGR
mgnify:CR=1 FL=1